MEPINLDSKGFDIHKQVSAACVIGDLSAVRSLYEDWKHTHPDEDTRDPHRIYSPFGHGNATAFLIAAGSNGHAELISYLLEQNLGALSYAVRDLVFAKDAIPRKIEVLEAYLKSGKWDINEVGAAAPGPISAAVHDENLIRWFLANGADPNSRAKNYATTPIMIAARTGTLGSVKALHKGGARLTDALHEAAAAKLSDRMPIIEYLLENGAKPNELQYQTDLPTFLHWANLGGVGTPLHRAIRSGNTIVANRLIKAGASIAIPELRTATGPDALQLAEKCNLELDTQGQKPRSWRWLDEPPLVQQIRLPTDPEPKWLI